MKNLKGACLFGQSGGPTSVINSSAAGVFTEALRQKNVTAVYGADHGIAGVLAGKLFDISKEDPREIELLKYTPSAALGSSRYKMKDASADDTDYKRLLEVFKRFDVRYFFFNGGNDSMDTCNKVSKFMKTSGWDCNVIGVPKTIDNDLYGTDHCPGYGSAARYIATTVMECVLDAKVYNRGTVCIMEIMGRNAGWLTAASKLAAYKGLGPDLIYLPELPFDESKFVSDVQAVCDANEGKCFVALSEGVKLSGGAFSGTAGAVDSFGHAQLGGVGAVLGEVIRERTGAKVRTIELSLMQRCGAHLASETDVNEAFEAGAAAVRAAVSGETDKMVVFERGKGDEYSCETRLMPLELAANTEKKVPLEWITRNGTDVSDEFVRYALPLIGKRDCKAPLEDGLPRFARLRKIPAIAPDAR